MSRTDHLERLHAFTAISRSVSLDETVNFFTWFDVFVLVWMFVCMFVCISLYTFSYWQWVDFILIHIEFIQCYNILLIAAITLVDWFISMRIDYCNSILWKHGKSSEHVSSSRSSAVQPTWWSISQFTSYAINVHWLFMDPPILTIRDSTASECIKELCIPIISSMIAHHYARQSEKIFWCRVSLYRCELSGLSGALNLHLGTIFL